MSFEFLGPRPASLDMLLDPWISALRFSRWTIKTRISVLVVALVVPLNLVIFAVIKHLAESASEMQRTGLLYSARSVAAAVDAKLGEYITLTQVLARSPALLEASLDAFEAEARRAFLSTEDGWIIVADLEGQQLLNTAALGRERLPVRNSVSLEAQRLALETGSAAVSKVQFGRVSQSWIIDIVVPVFKNGKLFRALSVSLKAQAFLRLLSDQQIPRNWFASIIDGDGRFIARVPAVEGMVGQLTSQSWRKVMHEDGVFDLVLMDGDPIVSAQARPAASRWNVGIAVKKAELDAAVWGTIRWAALCGGGLSVLSLLLASALSRRIARPIAELRLSATELMAGTANVIPAGPPEVRDLWSALKQSTAKRRKTENLLAEREERFRATFENAAVGIAHVAPDGTFLLVNRRLCQILGYKPEEIHSKRFQDITHPDDLEADQAQVRRMLAGEIDSYSMEKRYVRKNSSTVWARLTVGAVHNEDGTIRYFIPVVEDISQKRLVDMAMRESEERFRGIYEHAGTGIAITDIQGRLQNCNPAYTAMLGYTEAELRQIGFSGLIHPEDRGTDLEQVRRLISQEIPSFEITNRYLGKTGKLVWVHKHVSLLRDSQGSPVNLIALVSDISERKRYEERVRESEEQLQLALDAAQLGTWRWQRLVGPEALRCDARFHALFGLPQDTKVTKKVLINAILPEDRAKTEAAMARALDPGDPCDDYVCEFRIKHPDGTVIWLSSMGRAFFEPDLASIGGRRAVQIAGAVRDVTEAHLVKAVRESEERLRHLGDSLPDNAVYRYAHEAGGTPRYHYISAGIEPLNRVRVEDVLRDASVLLGQILPEYLPLLAEAEKRSASDMSDFKAEVPMRRPDGEVRWMRLQSRPQRMQDGTVVWDGVQTDITDQKRAESALRESEERFRGIFDNAGTGIAITDMKGRFQCCNPAYVSLLGYSEPELRQLHCNALIHPDDREQNLFEKRRLDSAEIPSFKIVNRYVAKAGTPIWVHKHVSLLRDASGKPTNTITLVTDVNERMRQEDHIRLLMREVNHRSKNLLTVVQSIARHTALARPADFVERFEMRISALAASQDLLVKNEWKGVDLEELVRSQLAHFEDLIGTRITLQGPPLFISASAAQAIGMALHELATNAGKHGALAGGAGLVTIEWRIKRSGNHEETFAMGWRELCTDSIQAPSKQGFGSTVIGQIVEMKLDAKVDLEFPSTGLTWRLRCPADQILERSRPAFVKTKAKRTACKTGASTRPRVLVVEDEAIVALEIASVLVRAGFEVVGPARSVGQALNLIDERGCDAAVLDINLGSETSEPIAHRLRGAGTSFVTVSGYSQEQHPAVFGGAPALTKPLQGDLLIAELKTCLTADAWAGLS